MKSRSKETINYEGETWWVAVGDENTPDEIYTDGELSEYIDKKHRDRIIDIAVGESKK